MRIQKIAASLNKPNILSMMLLFSKVSAALSILIGIFVFLGWTFDVGILKSINSNWVTMKVNTSIAFIFTGLSFTLLLPKEIVHKRYVIGNIFAAIAALIGLLSFFEYFFEIDFGIDQLIFQESSTAIGTTTPGRMSPSTALNFIFIGVALLLSGINNRASVLGHSLLCLFVNTISFLALLGYLYGISAFYGIAPYTQMAVHTAALFFILSLGILFSRPDQGIVERLARDTSGGLILRWSTPTIAILLVLFGWLGIQGLRAEFYGAEFVISLTVIIFALVMAGFIFGITGIVDHGDIEKRILAKQIKKHTQDIEKSYLFVNTVLENIPNMVFIKEARELRFVRFNKAGEELLGYKRDELIGKNDYDFFKKSEADFFTKKDRETLSSGKILDIPEEPIQTKFKGERILHTKKITLYDEKDQPEFLLGISEDITEKKQAEEQHSLLLKEQFARAEAEKMVQQRDDFISIAAHELRTPLTSISIQTQLLSNLLPKLEFPNIQKYIGMVQNSKEQIEQLTKLVENLLDVTRASSGRLIIEKTEVDLSEVILQITKNLETEFIKSKCKLELHLESSIIGRWDRTRIEQVLMNLLSNAMKFGAGKLIEISTKVAGDNAILVVRDHGIGISKADQAKLFNRFERAVSMKSFGGLGLGLYIAREIVTAHGGSIRVESELGKGSSFIVELPLSLGTTKENPSTA